ncbi:MAG TPA: hypothetical protein VF052_09570 [Solirubrobacterales bacterium]
MKRMPEAKGRTEMKRRLFGVPIAAALCAVVFLGLAAPASAVLPTYSNGFETNTDGWFTTTGGTITREASGSSNLGGYADPVASASGTYHARLGRTTCERTNTFGGAGDAAHCSGPNTNWGGVSPPTFPVGGYTTQVDIYLDAAYAQANREPNNYGGNFACLAPVPETDPPGATDAACKGTRFDYSSAINNNTGTHLRDFGFNVSTGLSTGLLPTGEPCSGFTVTGQTVVNRANANPLLDNYDPQCIPNSGWYTFKHTFSEEAGYLKVVMEIIPVGSTTPTASWTITGIDEISTVGCERYGWFTNQEIYGLPIDNASMTGCGTPPLPDGKISPTGTTCQQYADGTAPVLGQLLYTTKGGLINAVSPGVFFYYTKVSGTEGQTVDITQTDNSTASAIPIQQRQVVLYDASEANLCKVLKWTPKVNDPVGTATGDLPSSGDFIIGVKYNPAALKGGTVPVPSPATYSFGTELDDAVIPADAATIDLAPKQ